MCEVLKSTKKRDGAVYCVQLCVYILSTQKQRYPFIFWQILTIRTSFSRELFQDIDFLFKIET
jgi:hypothetical protein